MNYKSTTEVLQQIEACSVIEYFVPGKNSEPIRAFGFGPDSFVIKGGDNLRKFNASVSSIYKEIPGLEKLVTVKELEKRIVAVITTAKKAGQALSDVNSKTLIDEIMKMPVKKWTVVRPLLGANIGGEADLILGPFTIFPTAVLDSRISAQSSNSHPFGVDLFGKNSRLCISCIVESNTGDRAQELATVLFEQFELVVAYMLGIRDCHYNVAVVNAKQRYVSQSMAFTSDGGLTMGSQLNGPIHDVDLHDPYFRSKETGHERLWELLSSSNHCEIEKRLVNAVEWAGRALLDTDDAKAFIQLMLAVESLLQIDQKTQIKPSIVSQLAETSAFILGEDCDSRIKLERRMKELYTRRSAHVHAGSRHVEKQDLYDALGFVKGLTHEFLVSPIFSKLHKMSDVAELTQKMKYTVSENASSATVGNQPLGA